MKKLLLTMFTMIVTLNNLNAQTLSSLKWAEVCSGKMGAAWYGSEESQKIADIVLDVQKTNGGWMKNDELHKLTANEYGTLKNARYDHSCLDNYATTQEMRFLAKVYQGCKVEKYKDAFIKALNMIFVAEKAKGGWSQYWPLSGGDSYQDYITFNDDLMLNVLRMLQDVAEAKGDFKDLLDEATREKCKEAYARGLQVILDCQIDDNGVKAAWCAQHDPDDHLPTEGRPHEMPSVSGFESANLLSYLMNIEKPSMEIQNAIHAAVKWLDEHKIPNKAVEDVKEGSTIVDRRIIDKPGTNLWGRFIQIGGESGKIVYNKFLNKLKTRNKKVDYQGAVYYEYDNASLTYDSSKEYQPIFSIYDDNYKNLRYRFLYNYEDTPETTDQNGKSVSTSLRAANRKNYQYVGSWCQNVIEQQYPAWKARMDLINNAGEATPFTIDATTHSSDDAGNWQFNDGFSISSNKGYATGKNSTLKFSRNVKFTISIPADKCVTKVAFTGYDNYADTDAYLKTLGSKTYGETEYVFPKKDGDNMVTVSHIVDLDYPAAGSLILEFGGQQVCSSITLYCMDISAGITSVNAGKKVSTANFNLAGQRVGKDYKGIIIENGKKIKK